MTNIPLLWFSWLAILKASHFALFLPKFLNLARILALDYGAKRTGIAVTDEMQLIATALETVPTKKLLTFVITYVQNEKVQTVVIGEPKQMSGQPSQIEPEILAFISKLKKALPELVIVRQDERFTSKLAMNAMVVGGFKKKQRQQKENVDKLSATIILQAFLERK